MAECYSSAGAPLNALANQLLGESSFSAKSSLFRSSQQQQQQQQQQQHFSHPQHLHQHQGLFPRNAPQQQLYKSGLDNSDPFEQAWSSSSSNTFNHIQQLPHSSFAGLEQYHHYQPQRQIPDLDLVSAWEQQEQLQLRQDQVNGQLHQTQTTLSGVTIASRPEFSTLEFESFPHTTDSTGAVHNNTDSIWAQEWSHQKGAETDDDDDDGDEFREEWSNDHFTQAYISSHQSKFREIEEQDRLKEARLEEERERQRQASGGPPRSTWMMAGAISTVTETAGVSMHGPKRLRVPGLDSFEHPQNQQETAFSVDEFMSLDYNDNVPPQFQHFEQHKEPKPVRSEDRFLSLVSDMHLAEQIYYPGATSATLPELSESDPQNTLTASTGAMQSLSSTGEWAQEFAVEDRQRQQKQWYVGAEWNWEKLFGKDPRRPTSSTSSSGSVESGIVDENDRLRAVALTRLQALFGHLSLTSPQESASAP